MSLAIALVTLRHFFESASLCLCDRVLKYLFEIGQLNEVFPSEEPMCLEDDVEILLSQFVRPAYREGVVLEAEFTDPLMVHCVTLQEHVEKKVQ